MVFTGVDVGVAVLVLISAILATARGFTREVLSLVTWVGAAILAAYMYFNHRDLAEQYISEPWVATGVTVIGTFLVALIVLHLLTMWIGDLVVDSRIGPLDRTLGFVFGAVRGVFLCVIAAVFVTFLMGPEERLPPMVRDAKSYAPLMSMGDWVIERLPPNVESQITDFLEKKGQNADSPGPNDAAAPADTTDASDAADDASDAPAVSSEPLTD